MKRIGKTRRKRVRQEEILSFLRDLITTGTQCPGDRLPSQWEVAEQFGTSPLTVKRAFRKLVDQGFARAEPNVGRFVAEQPPNLTRYAMVFHSHPDAAGWGGLSHALLGEATTIAQRGEKKMPCFFGVSGHADAEDFQTLVRDVEAHRVAGLIFTTNPYLLEGTPILDEPGIPRVAIMGLADSLQIPTVALDGPSWTQRAARYLASRGRRRVAAVFRSAPGSTKISNFERQITDAAQAHGLDSRPHWRQFADVADPQSVSRVIHLLMHRGQHERPDALIVTDDTMFDAAMAGLAAAGVKVPDDVLVIAHCNFPRPPASALPPVKRLGYRARQVIETCVDLLDRQRRGESVPRQTLIPPVFDDELES